MDFLAWFAVFIVAKTTQYVWTLYMIGVLVKHRLKYGKDFFKKVEHKKPSCLEGWNEGYLQLNNIRMHYVQTGKDDAPLLLMLHGFPEFWYSWRFQLRPFEKDYRCVDMRGYILTDKRLSVTHPGKRRETSYKKAFLMAHDWGAGVAWRTAQMFPDHIEKLIILNTPHPNANSFEQFYKSWFFFFFQSACIPEMALSAGDYAKLDESLLGSEAGIRNKENFTEEDLEAYKYVFSQPGALTSPLNYFRSLKDLTFVKGEDKFIKPPTLIMFPTADIHMSQTAAEKSLKYCRNGQIKIIKTNRSW